MASLSDDIAYYDEHRSSLEADHFAKWVVIQQRQILAFYPDFETAAAAAVEQFGRGPYLIRQVGAPGAPPPASLFYRAVDEDRSVRV